MPVGRPGDWAPFISRQLHACKVSFSPLTTPPSLPCQWEGQKQSSTYQPTVNCSGHHSVAPSGGCLIRGEAAAGGHAKQHAPDKGHQKKGSGPLVRPFNRVWLGSYRHFIMKIWQLWTKLVCVFTNHMVSSFPLCPHWFDCLCRRLPNCELQYLLSLVLFLLVLITKMNFEMSTHRTDLDLMKDMFVQYSWIQAIWWLRPRLTTCLTILLTENYWLSLCRSKRLKGLASLSYLA